MAMTRSPQSNLSRTCCNLVAEAQLQGLTPANPVRILLSGSTQQGDLFSPSVWVEISYTEPDIVDDVRIWLNPATNEAFKSDPYLSIWRKLYMHCDLHSAYRSVVGDDGANPPDLF